MEAFLCPELQGGPTTEKNRQTCWKRPRSSFQTALPEMSLCWKHRHPPRTAPSVKLGQLTLTLTSPRIAAEHNGGSHRTATSRTRLRYTGVPGQDVSFNAYSPAFSHPGSKTLAKRRFYPSKQQLTAIETKTHGNNSKIMLGNLYGVIGNSKRFTT